MRELLEIHDVPPYEVRQAFCEWLRHHGIDPNRVPVPCTLVRCEDTRRIWYPELARDEHGELIRTSDGATWLLHQRVLQLEAVPSPFPSLRGIRFDRTQVFQPALYLADQPE